MMGDKTMNKIKIITIAALIVFIFGCSDEFLERDALYGVNNETYYRTEKDMQEALTGAYSVLPVAKGETNPILLAQVLSDDVLGGGDGAGDAYIRLVDKFEDNTREDVFAPLWQRYYQGIFRVNSIIDNSENASYENQDNLKRDLGEAYFLRAFMYLELSKFFGRIPLIVTPLSGNEPRAAVEATFAQIASDLKTAIEFLPAIPYASMEVERNGHATKWAAETLMARAFLFYTGTYDKAELPLVDGGVVSKSQVVSYLEDVRDNSGHSLLTNFPEMWAYTATGLKDSTVLTDVKGKEIIDTVASNKFVSDNGYQWADDNGTNSEFIWTFKFNTFGGDPAVDLPRANQVVLFSGIRLSKCVPHGVGWGFCTVHPDLWNSFDNSDIRKYGSMFNVEDPVSASLEGTTAAMFQQMKPSYDGYSVTGVFNKKWMPVQQQNDDNIARFSDLWIYRGYTFTNSQFAFVRPIPILRYADVLLMHSELTGDVAGINAVRTRAGLGPVASVTSDVILAERRHEFAFEGHRYFDLMRMKKLEERFNWLKNNPIDVSDGGMSTEGVFYKDKYGDNAWNEDRKFVQIPESQIRLSAGVLDQNSGWE